MTENGQQQASDIWASVNSAAAAAAKGTWEGVKPVKKVLFSDVLYSPKREAFLRKWVPTDITYASFIGAMHLGCLLAPFTFTWSAFNCFLVMYFITGCLGITLSYHRQLSHKSFNTPKWLEYLLAYCGAMAVQGDPWSGRRATGTTTSTATRPRTRTRRTRGSGGRTAGGCWTTKPR